MNKKIFIINKGYQLNNFKREWADGLSSGLNKSILFSMYNIY